MNHETFVDYCLAKKGAEATFPFGGDTLVIKVMGKMFAACGMDSFPLSINLKCDPEWAEILRADYEDIQPGYHMNKKHWNTVLCEGSLEYRLIAELIDHSYHLVVNSLTKLQKAELEKL